MLVFLIMRKIMLAQSSKAYYRNATIGSERILALCMKTSTSVVKVLSVYAPPRPAQRPKISSTRT